MRIFLPYSFFTSIPAFFTGLSKICLVIICIGFGLLNAQAQKAGFIYTKASNGGEKVLDPNNDGYVSLSSAGFVGGDIGSNYSEIPYRFFPQFGVEPLADLVTGANGGHTDLAEPPLGMYFDGQNVMFRVRLGGSSTASKGYSYFFDTDGIFNGVNAETGVVIPYNTPSKVVNLGFEFEVVFASNFDVRVYKHTGSGDDSSPYSASIIWQGNMATYSQRAQAFTTTGSDADYFYDFFVPLSAFQGGITAATKLRLTGSTVTSAQSGLSGTISDVGGIDDRLYANDAKTIWKQIVPAFPRTSLTDLMNGEFSCLKSTAPVITSTVKEFDSSVSGTSSEATGTVIKVYSGGTVSASGAWSTTGSLLGSGTVSNGTWTVSINPVISTVGTVIRATATSVSPQKCESNPSTAVTATNGVCSTPSITTAITATNGNKGFSGTYTMPSYLTGSTNRVRIMLYKVDANNNMAKDSISVFGAGATTPTSYFGTALSAGSVVSWSIGSQQGNSLVNGTYVIRVAINGGCVSGPSLSQCVGNGMQSTPTPTITTISPTPTTAFTLNKASTTTLTIQGSIGTTTATSTKVYLYNNGNLTSFVSPVVSTSGGTYTITLTTSDLSSFAPGDILTVRAIGSTATTTYCLSAASTQAVTVVNGTTAAPTITTTLCLPSSGSSTFSVYGTSTELGSIITLFNGATALTSTPTSVIVNGQGIWSATVTATASFSITAKATATNKYTSASSAVANITSQATNTAASGIQFYSGNYTTPISTSSYIYEGTGADGAVYGKVSVPANTRATIKVYLNKDQLASEVSITSDNNTAATTANNWILTGLSTKELFVGGLITATVTYSSIGTGGTASCESNHITPSGVNPYSSSTVTLQQYDYVQCQTPPTDRTITWQTNGTICYNSKISASIASSEVGVLYQMQRTTDGTTWASTGDPVVGTGFSIIVYSAEITSTATGSLRLIATKNSTSYCQTTLSTTKPITGYTLTGIITAPTISVTASSASATAITTVCNGQTVNIRVTNPQTGGTYQLFQNSVAVGSATTYSGSGNLNLSSAALQINASFYVIFTNTSGCTSTSATTNITVKGPSLTNMVSIDKTSNCTSPSTVTISIGTENNSQYTYQVVQVSGPTGSNLNIGTAFTGDGSVKTISTTLSTAGSYVFKVTVTDNSTATCGTQNLTKQVTTAVGQSPATANANSTNASTSLTSGSVTLSGSDASPGTGLWAITSQPSGSNAYFSDATQRNTTIYGLISGSYTFTWTVTNTCSNTTTSSAVTYSVNTNTPASYTVSAPDYINNYTTNEVLATASDVDGFNTTGTNFTLKGGSALPPGTALDATTGNIYVTNPGSLVPGTYTFNILATDKTTSASKTTDVPVTMTFYQAASERTLVALPVSLIYFTGSYTKGKVLLNWATASETNNMHFEIERSSDGKNFVSIGKVAGAGTSVNLLKYSFTDTTPRSGTSYYRLKQTDLDETTDYSRIVPVNVSDKQQLQQILAYPNPTNKDVNIRLINATTEEYSFELFDLIGNKIKGKIGKFGTESQEITIEMESLPTGTYILISESASTKLVTRIIKN